MRQYDSCIYPVVMDIVSCHLNNGVSKSDVTTISAVEVPLLLCKRAVQLSMVWCSYQLHRCTRVIWVIVCATELQIDINKWEVVLLEDEKITIGLSLSVIKVKCPFETSVRLSQRWAFYFGVSRLYLYLADVKCVTACSYLWWPKSLLHWCHLIHWGRCAYPLTSSNLDMTAICVPCVLSLWLHCSDSDVPYEVYLLSVGCSLLT